MYTSGDFKGAFNGAIFLFVVIICGAFAAGYGCARCDFPYHIKIEKKENR